jgi:hypothetical protein
LAARVHLNVSQGFRSVVASQDTRHPNFLRPFVLTKNDRHFHFLRRRNGRISAGQGRRCGVRVKHQTVPKLNEARVPTGLLPGDINYSNLQLFLSPIKSFDALLHCQPLKIFFLWLDSITSLVLPDYLAQTHDFCRLCAMPVQLAEDRFDNPGLFKLALEETPIGDLENNRVQRTNCSSSSSSSPTKGIFGFPKPAIFH